MKSIRLSALLIFMVAMLATLGLVGASSTDKWAILDSSNQDVWHVTSAGILEGGAGSGGFNPQKLVSQTVTANTTLTSTSPLVTLCTNVTAVIYLPDATTCSGKPIHLKYHSGTAGNISVDGNGSQTIDGDAVVNITTRGHLGVISDGSNWAIIDN